MLGVPQQPRPHIRAGDHHLLAVRPRILERRLGQCCRYAFPPQRRINLGVIQVAYTLSR